MASVRIPNLPVEYFNGGFLKIIGHAAENCNNHLDGTLTIANDDDQGTNAVEADVLSAIKSSRAPVPEVEENYYVGRIPNLMPNVPSITYINCMVWNLQGTRSKNKIAVLKEVVKTYKTTILALVETHMGGDHAENIRKIIGYVGDSRVDEVGFSGGICVRHLPALQSNHCPLMIAPNGFAPLNSVQKLFRFQAAWMTHELFSTFIAEKWPTIGPFPSRVEDLSKSLQDWNENVFGNIFHQKKSLLARIEGCRKKLPVFREKRLIALEATLRKELDEVLEREELYWYQKSRVEFIIDGDRNTSYFHISTLVGRWQNKISS
ncbi:uncharacterized protein LOC141651937 [Silene latifolia]|uniref:uncharacterized protein LOC141651937 n=1 Tax=Silene latifolia TaxID=37657 RepID=UPI003D781BD5